MRSADFLKIVKLLKCPITPPLSLSDTIKVAATAKIREFMRLPLHEDKMIPGQSDGNGCTCAVSLQIQIWNDCHMNRIIYHKFLADQYI